MKLFGRTRSNQIWNLFCGKVEFFSSQCWDGNANGNVDDRFNIASIRYECLSNAYCTHNFHHNPRINQASRQPIVSAASSQFSRCDSKQMAYLVVSILIFLLLFSSSLFLLPVFSSLSLSLLILLLSSAVPYSSICYLSSCAVLILNPMLSSWIVVIVAVVLFSWLSFRLLFFLLSFIVCNLPSFSCGYNLKNGKTNAHKYIEPVNINNQPQTKTIRPLFHLSSDDAISIEFKSIYQIFFTISNTVSYVRCFVVDQINSYHSILELLLGQHRLNQSKQSTFSVRFNQSKLLLFVLLHIILTCSTTLSVTAIVLRNYEIDGLHRSLIHNNSRHLNKYLHNSNSIDSFEQQYDGDNGDDEDDSDKTAYPAIKALVNRSVGLPCNISQTKEENSIKLILWYKNNILGSPIYSIDARDTNISLARHFVAPSYRERASFELSLSSRTALLFVKPLLADDDGQYICRVDFRWTRTTISTVKLDVIVPPQRLRLIHVEHSMQPRQSSYGPSRHNGRPMQSTAHYQHHYSDASSNSHSNQYASPQQTIVLPKEMLSLDRQNPTHSNINNKNRHRPRLRPNDTSSSMINYIRTVRQAEETVLSLYCDSIGGKPNSIVKWYRLIEYELGQPQTTEHRHNRPQKPINAAELYSILEITDEKMLELIDDSCYEMNLTEKQRTAEAEQRALDAESFEEEKNGDENRNKTKNAETNLSKNLSKTADSSEDRVDPNAVSNSDNELFDSDVVADSHVNDSERQLNKKRLLSNKNKQNKVNARQTSAIRLSRHDPTERQSESFNPEQATNRNRMPLSVSSNVVRNELHFGTIYSSNHGQLYLCRTSNSNLSKPLDLIVRLEIYTQPKSIQIRQQLPSKKFYPPPPPPPRPSSASNSESASMSKLSPLKSNVGDVRQHNRTLHSIELLDYYLNANQPSVTSRANDFSQPKQPFRLRSGFEFEFICQTNGSYPSANISWFLKEYQTNLLKDITPLSYASYSDHSTLSLLQFVPKFTDNKACLICRAYNQILRNKQASIVSATTSIISASSFSSASIAHSNQHSTTFGGSSSPQSQSANLSPSSSSHYQVSGLSASLSSESSPAISALSQNQDLHYQLETSVPLDVNYPPIVSIKVLSGEQMFHEVEKHKQHQNVVNQNQSKTHKILEKKNKIENEAKNFHQFVEMQEIFFNCSISANPEVYIVQWYFNNKLLHTDLSQGIIITNLNRTLIISAASRKYSGNFYCRAANILGETASEKHQIDILYKPQCLVDFVQINYHQLGDLVWLKCQIVANPIENLKFTWKFNGTTFLGGGNNDDDVDGSASDGLSLSADLFKTQDANQSLASYSVVDHTVSVYSDGESTGATTNNQPKPKKKNMNHRHNDDRWTERKELRSGLVASSSTTTTHSTTRQQHLITNVVQIQLKHWNSFGHFSCQSGNQVGQQTDACKWHVLPATATATATKQQQHRHHGSDYVISPEHLNSVDSNSMNPHHPFRMESSHHQQQHSHRGHHQNRQHSKASSSWMASTLNNCQIIESSNAVVIKCRHSDFDHSHNEQPNGDSEQHLLVSSEDSLPELQTDEDGDRFMSSSSSFSSSKENDHIYRTNSAELNRDLLSQFPFSRVTYHVQVFELPDIGGGSSSNGGARFNGSLVTGSKSDWNIKLLPTVDNGAEQQQQEKQQKQQQKFSHQIDQNSKLEPDKQIASKSPSSSFISSSSATTSSSSSSSSSTPNVSNSILSKPVLLFDIVNFTNPLFIITNLSASTTYLLKIWSSKASNLDSVIEQVNITVRTRPNDDDLLSQLADKRKLNPNAMSGTLATLLQIGNDKLVLLLGLIALVSFVFVSLTLTYAIFKIRAILDIRKARRDLNVNESINAFETALCEMRPETLETDLKSKNVNYSTVLDTFRPYVNVGTENSSNIGMSVLSDEHHNSNAANLQASSSTCSTLKCNLPDSSLIKYQNYLYPSATLPTGTNSATQNGSIRINCSDEESVSTQNTSVSNRSMLTNTTDSTIATTTLNYPVSEMQPQQQNSIGSNHHHQYSNHCFQTTGVTLDTTGAATATTANVIFCMDSGDGSNSGHAFLVPDSYHQYPLQLQILPENGQEDTTAMVEQFGSSIEIRSNCITPSRSKSSQFHLPQLSVGESIGSISLNSVRHLSGQNDDNNNNNQNHCDQLTSQQQSSLQTAV